MGSLALPQQDFGWADVSARVPHALRAKAVGVNAEDFTSLRVSSRHYHISRQL